ncbi:MAG: hypothetical protein AB1758_16435, partial [Candidatus Eremiobacterota bacterium]
CDPWYITMKALEDYLLLRGVDPACSDDVLNRVEGELVEMARLTVDSSRQPRRIRNGLLAYRGPQPLRLTLIVNEQPRAEGDLPQLVGVSGNPEHMGKKRKSRPAAKRRSRG